MDTIVFVLVVMNRQNDNNRNINMKRTSLEFSNSLIPYRNAMEVKTDTCYSFITNVYIDEELW